MAGFSFNASEYQPRCGGDSAGLPAGKHKVILEKGEMTPVRSNPNNSYLALNLKCIEGLAQGGSQVDRLNVHNSDATAVRIANERLSAYCAAMGRPGFGDISELYNIPFYIETMPQVDNPRFSNIVGLFDINGTAIGKGAAPAQVQAAPAAPPQGFAPQGGGFQQPPPQQQPQQGWQAPQQDQGAQPQPQQPWQQPGPGPQAQPQQQAPWSPGTGGAAPGWSRQ